jgi:subtilisin family serine protease
MSDLKEYIVTLHRREDLDDFYEDMETVGGNLYIPNRKVDCALRREISRNTHYLLTTDEVEQLKQDSRVMSVELLPSEMGMVVRPLYSQTSSVWNKSSTDVSTHKNWGLLRCVQGTQISNWGSNGTASQTGTIRVNAEGKNVDVVIVDGMINPAHPEFAVNANGTGGTRVVQFNWRSYLGQTYTYTPYIDPSNATRTGDNNHGMHVAGTVAGNTQGWARSSRIYNINPYSTDPNSVDPLLVIDHIRNFHNNKTVNSATGIKNPTICNHSWGYGFELAISGISSVVYRGSVIAGPFTEAQLLTYGIVASGGQVFGPGRVNALDQDMIDAIADGIIMVGAASNDSAKVDITTGTDYNNRFIWSGLNVFYHRGSSPGAATNTICVGAVSSLVNESKADFSNCGPRVDIYAPGQWIMSSLHNGGVFDTRDVNFRAGKYQGTSMASPQVCGVLACALEIYPRMKQAEAVAYIKHYARLNQMTNTAGGYSDLTSLQGSDNRYLFYYQERKDTGAVFPKNNYKIRTTSVLKYPRTRIRRTI